jgi:hypothetical protein
LIDPLLLCLLHQGESYLLNKRSKSSNKSNGILLNSEYPAIISEIINIYLI